MFRQMSCHLQNIKNIEVKLQLKIRFCLIRDLISWVLQCVYLQLRFLY